MAIANTADVQVNDNPKITDEATVIPAKGSVKLIKVLEGAGEEAQWPAGEKAIFKLEQEVNSAWAIVDSNIEVAGFEAVTISDLVPGTYKLTELAAPEGYLLAEPQTFTINGDETSVQELTFTDPKLPTPQKKLMKILWDQDLPHLYDYCPGDIRQRYGELYHRRYD